MPIGDELKPGYDPFVDYQHAPTQEEADLLKSVVNSIVLSEKEKISKQQQQEEKTFEEEAKRTGGFYSKDDPIYKSIQQHDAQKRLGNQIFDIIYQDKIIEQEAQQRADREEKIKGLTEPQIKVADELDGDVSSENVEKFIQVSREANQLENKFTISKPLTGGEIAARAIGKFPGDKWYDKPSQWFEYLQAGIETAGKITGKGIKELFTDKIAGLTEEESKRYNELIKEKQNLLKPLEAKYKQRSEETVKDESTYLEKSFKITAYGSPIYTGVGGITYKEAHVPAEEAAKYGGTQNIPTEKLDEYEQKYKEANLLVQRSKDNMENLTNYLEGDDGFWSGFWTKRKDLSTMGFNSLVVDLGTAKIVKKAREGAQLSDYEEKVLKIEGVKQETQQLGLNEDRYLYGLGEGVGESAVFAEQFLLPGGRVAATGIKGISFGLERSILSKILQSGSKLTEAQISALSKIRTSRNFLAGIGQVGAQAATTPYAYEAAAQKYIGPIQIVTDENGEDKILYDERSRSAYQKKAKNIAIELDYEEKQLNDEIDDKDSDEYKSKFKEIQQRRDNLNSDLKSIYDPYGKSEETILKEVGIKDALLYGLIEGIKETGSELFVGKGFKGLFSLASKMPIAKPVFDAAKRKLITPLGNASDWFGGFAGKTPLGKITQNALYHTRANTIWHGLPSEIMEEVAVQLTPSYEDNFWEKYKKQTGKLGDSQFYIDTALQTIIMGGAFTGAGAAKHLYSYKTNEAYKSHADKVKGAIKRAKDTYQAIDKGIESDAKAREIIMAVGGTQFAGEDYQGQIREMRLKNQHKQADHLENRFFSSAIDALETGSLPEYKRALQRAIKNQEFKEAGTKAKASMALENLKSLEEIADEHEDSPNRNALMTAEINKLRFEKVLDDTEKEINDPESIKKFDAFVKAFREVNPEYKDTEFNREDFNANDNKFISALAYSGDANTQKQLILFQIKEDAKTMYNESQLTLAAEGRPERIEKAKKDSEYSEMTEMRAASSKQSLEAFAESAKYKGTQKIAEDKLKEIYDITDYIGDAEKAEQIAHQNQSPAADLSQQTEAATAVITYITDIATGKQTEYTRQGISDSMKTDIEEREKELGKALGFADYIEDKVKAGYPIEKIFARLALAWEDAKGETVENRQDIFDTYFKYGDPNAEQIPAPPVAPTIIEAEQEAEKIVEEAHEVPESKTVIPGVGVKETRGLNSVNPRLVVFGQDQKRTGTNMWHSERQLKSKESGNPVKNHYLLDTDFMYEVEQESRENPGSLTARQHDVDDVVMPTSSPERLDISFTGEDGTVYPIVIKKKSEDEEITWGRAKEVARNYFLNKPDAPKRYQQWVNQYVPVVVVYKGEMSNNKPVIISTLRDHQYYNAEDDNTQLETPERLEEAANNTIKLRNEIGGTKAKAKNIGFTKREYGQEHRVNTSGLRPQPLSSFGVDDLQLGIAYIDPVTGGKAADIGQEANGEKIVLEDALIAKRADLNKRKIVMLVKGEKTDRGKDRYAAVTLVYDSPSSIDPNLKKDYPAPLQSTIKQAIAASILLNAKGLTSDQLTDLQQRVGINKTQADAIRSQIKSDFGDDITDPNALEDYIRSFSDGVFNKEGESTVAFDLLGILNIHFRVEAFKEFTDNILPKYELALNLKRLPSKDKVRLVNEQGNFSEAKTYSQVMQDYLRSPVIIHPIETIEGKTIGIIDVNPAMEVEALEGGGTESEIAEVEKPVQVLKPADEVAPLQVTKPKGELPSVEIKKGQQITELDNIITKLLLDPDYLQKMLDTDYAKNNYILQFLQKKAAQRFKGGFSNAFLVSPDVKYEQLTKEELLNLALSYYLHSKLENPEITNPIDGFPDIHFRMAYMMMTDKGIVMETPVIDFKENQVLVDDKTVLVDDKILSFVAQQVFETELNRVIASYKNPTAFKNYAEASKLFHNVASFNSITIKTNSGADANIHNVLKTLRGDISPNLRAKMIEAAKAKISSYIQSETNKKTEKGSEDKRREMAEFSVNNLLNQVAKQQIFLKDAAFYSTAKLPVTEEDQVDVDKLNDPRFLQDMADELSAELQKAYNKALAAGEKLPDSKNKRIKYSQEFNHITLDGKINIDEYFKKFMPDTEIPEKGSTQFVTWPFYLEMLERLGKITPERRKELTKSIENKTATTEDLVKLQSKEFNPGKHTYTGEVYESGVLRPIHIEASFFPLFPQLTEGLPLDAIRASMEELEKRDSKTKEYIPVTASSKASFKIGGLKKGAVYNGSVAPFKVRLPISGFRLLPTEKAQGIALSPTHTFGSKAANERFKELYSQYSDLATKALEDELGITTAEKNSFDELPEERQNIIISKMLDMLGVKQVFENGKTSAVSPLIFDSRRRQFDALLKDIVAGKVANLTIPEKAEYSALEKELIDLYKKHDVSAEEGVEMSDLNADLISKKTTAASEDVSAFSDGYQNNNDGKIGEKEYNNAIALQIQMQALPESKKVNLNTVTVSTNTALKSTPFVESIGGLTFNGVLSESKYPIKSLSEYQRVAENNLTNQVMVKRNENFYTIPVYALMAHMGFDLSIELVETGFIAKDGKEYKGKLHIPSLFMNQPVIRRYTKLMEAGRTSSNPYAHEENVIGKLFTEFGFVKYESGDEGTRDYLGKDEYKKTSKELDARSLFIMLDPVNASQNVIKQQAILQKFLRFADKARELKRIQDLFNLTGTSYFDTIQKIELMNTIAELHLLAEEGESNNYTHLIGDVTDIDPNSKEYVKTGNFYWKPETIRGKQLINALKLETKVMPSLFPYNSNFITGMIDSILEERGIDPRENSDRNVKERQDIMNNLSAFINAKTDGMDSQKKNEYLRHVYDIIRDETLEDSEMLPFLRKEFIDDYFKRTEVDVMEVPESLKEDAIEPEPKREGFQGYRKGTIEEAKAIADVVITESDKGIESEIKNPEVQMAFVSRGTIGALSDDVKETISGLHDFGIEITVKDADAVLIEHLTETGANFTIQFLGAFPENQASEFPLEGNEITQEDIKGLPKLPCE